MDNTIPSSPDRSETIERTNKLADMLFLSGFELGTMGASLKDLFDEAVPRVNSALSVSGYFNNQSDQSPDSRNIIQQIIAVATVMQVGWAISQKPDVDTFEDIVGTLDLNDF